jgi:anti-anti-sigma regulatory factor
MDIVVSHEQGRAPVTVFHLKGPLVWDEEILAQAQKAFEAGTRNILLDLTEVPYMSSQGLRALNSIYTLLRTDAPSESHAAVSAGVSAGTYTSPHLKLLKPSKSVAEVLRISGYDMFLEIHQDFKKALASF